MTIKVAIGGVAGRMGKALVRATLAQPKLTLVGGTERSQSEFLNRDLGTLVGDNALGVTSVESLVVACQSADIWIDFTTPEATIGALQELRGTSVKVVIIGTTGLTPEHMAQVSSAASHFAIVQSGNFSLGVNLVAGLVRQAAQRLGPDWDIEIIESHHRQKVDAPSGTALMLGQAAAQGRGVDHDQVAAFARHGQTGARQDGDIGYAVVRGGGIIGEHETLFLAEDETISLSHKAASRTIFARGALAAAIWGAEQPPGLYSMADVLGF